MSGTGAYTRRRALGLMAGAGAGLGAGALGVRRIAFAQSDGSATNRRPLVLVLMQGGLDGLALLPPLDLPAERQPVSAALGTRPIDLDGRFALNPAAGALLPFWRAERLAFVPAAAGPYRGRDGRLDHATAARVLATGTADPDSPAFRSGWLNRALAAGDAGQDGRPALALGGAAARGGRAPAVLVGPAPVEVAPPSILGSPVAGLMEKAAGLYTDDTLFAPALARAQKRRDLPAETLGADHVAAAAGGARPAFDFPAAAAVAGARLAAEDGPDTAVIELSGFDSHFGGEGALNRRLAALAGGLETLAGALGPAYERSVILAVSEFGRTVARTASGGTDHGLAGPMILLGGAVIGGIKGGWPGLAAEARAPGGGIAAAVDHRAVFKRVLGDHRGLGTKLLNARVFPDAAEAAPLAGLIRE